DRALQAVTGRGVAHPGTGIDVIVAEGYPHHLLHEESLLVGAARRGDPADGVAAIFRLDAPDLAGCVTDRLLPRDLPPFVADGLAEHGLELAIRMRRIAESKPALHTGVPVIGMAVTIGRHAHDLGSIATASDLGLEAAAHAAVGAGRGDGALRLTEADHRLLHQGRGWTGLDARPAGDALGLEERLVLAGGNLGGQAAALDGEREGPLHLIAGAHAARANNALLGVEGEVRIALVAGQRLACRTRGI